MLLISTLLGVADGETMGESYRNMVYKKRNEVNFHPI